MTLHEPVWPDLCDEQHATFLQGRGAEPVRVVVQRTRPPSSSQVGQPMPATTSVAYRQVINAAASDERTAYGMVNTPESISSPPANLPGSNPSVASAGSQDRSGAQSNWSAGGCGGSMPIGLPSVVTGWYNQARQSGDACWT